MSLKTHFTFCKLWLWLNRNLSLKCQFLRFNHCKTPIKRKLKAHNILPGTKWGPRNGLCFHGIYEWVYLTQDLPLVLQMDRQQRGSKTCSTQPLPQGSTLRKRFGHCRPRLDQHHYGALQRLIRWWTAHSKMFCRSFELKASVNSVNVKGLF